jgi:hypothetical protein
LDAANAGLAAATNRCRQLEGAAGVRELLALAGRTGEPGEGGLAAALSQQLDAAHAQLQQATPRLAAAEVTVQHQQKHIQQLANELQAAQAAATAAQECTEVLQLLSVRLQAGLKQQAALQGAQQLATSHQVGVAGGACGMGGCLKQGGLRRA